MKIQIRINEYLTERVFDKLFLEAGLPQEEKIWIWIIKNRILLMRKNS